MEPEQSLKANGAIRAGTRLKSKGFFISRRFLESKRGLEVGEEGQDKVVELDQEDPRFQPELE